jgi:hypothetical protein
MVYSEYIRRTSNFVLFEATLKHDASKVTYGPWTLHDARASANKPSSSKTKKQADVVEVPAVNKETPGVSGSTDSEVHEPTEQDIKGQIDKAKRIVRDADKKFATLTPKGKRDRVNNCKTAAEFLRKHGYVPSKECPEYNGADVTAEPPKIPVLPVTPLDDASFGGAGDIAVATFWFYVGEEKNEERIKELAVEDGIATNDNKNDMVKQTTSIVANAAMCIDPALLPSVYSVDAAESSVLGGIGAAFGVGVSSEKGAKGDEDPTYAAVGGVKAAETVEGVVSHDDHGVPDKADVAGDDNVPGEPNIQPTKKKTVSKKKAGETTATKEKAVSIKVDFRGFTGGSIISFAKRFAGDASENANAGVSDQQYIFYTVDVPQEEDNASKGNGKGQKKKTVDSDQKKDKGQQELEWLSEKHASSSKTPKYLPSVLLEGEVTDAMVDLCARLSNGKVEYETAVRCISTIMMKNRSYKAVNDEGGEEPAEDVEKTHGQEEPVVFRELELQQKKDKKPEKQPENEQDKAAVGPGGDSKFGPPTTKTVKKPIDKGKLNRVFENIRMCYNDTKSASDIALELYDTGDSFGMFDLTIAELRDEALTWDPADEIRAGHAKREDGTVRLIGNRYMHARLYDSYLMYITTNAFGDKITGALSLIDLKNKRDKNFDPSVLDNRFFDSQSDLKICVDALGVGITKLSSVFKDGRTTVQKKTKDAHGKLMEPFYKRSAPYNNPNNQPIGILSFDKDPSELKRALRIVLHGTDDDTDGFALSAHDRLTNETARDAMELHEMQSYLKENEVATKILRIPASSGGNAKDAVKLQDQAAKTLLNLDTQAQHNNERSVLSYALISGIRSRMSLFATQDAITKDAFGSLGSSVKRVFVETKDRQKRNYKVHTYWDYVRKVDNARWVQQGKKAEPAMPLLAESRCSFSGFQIPMPKALEIANDITDIELALRAVSLAPMDYLVDDGVMKGILDTIHHNLHFPITRAVLSMYAADSLEFLHMVQSHIYGEPSGFLVKETSRVIEDLPCDYGTYDSEANDNSKMENIRKFVIKTNECLVVAWREKLRIFKASEAAGPSGSFGKARSMRRFV